MARSGPTTLALPPFAGATRRLILILLGVFFVDAVAGLVLPRGVYALLLSHLELVPTMLAQGQIWQLFTYAFLPVGILGTLFALLTLWFTGSMLEDARGSRWLYELLFTSAVGGALVAVLISYTKLFHLDPGFAVGIGPWGGLYGLLIAIAVLMGDLEFLLFFIVRVKAKYLVAIYILIDLATLLKSANAFEALLHLSGAFCGYLFLKFVPRRGLAYGVTERYFSLRNDFYRNKRRRAARKFEVYMGKQGREVHFDKEGRYVDPDRNPPDKTSDKTVDKNGNGWMN